MVGWIVILAPVALGVLHRLARGRVRRILFHATVVSVMVLVFAALWVLPLGGTEGGVR